MMNSQLSERKLFTILGIFTLLSILYLNFSDRLFSFSSIPYLWQPMMDFAGVNRTRFVILNNERGGLVEDFYINGWNSYWLMAESVWSESREKVSEILERGAAMGLSVCRTWAFSDGPAAGPNALQLHPGVFNERAFQGLDYVVAEARRHRIRLILCLVNNLKAYGGTTQYVRWAQEAGVNVSSSGDSFFTNPTIKDYYKSYVKAVVTRKNSLSRIRYSDEPAIFAWELINEPRCTSSSCASDLQAWITEMAAFIKSLDHKHLVTIGLEGFYGQKTRTNLGVNPGEWTTSLGLDFIQNSATKNIDFASVHAYPQSWIPGANLTRRIDFLSRWVDSHINDGENVLKKPVLFTEVGFPLGLHPGGSSERDTLLRIVYDRIYESAKNRRAGAGALYWQLLVEGMGKQYGDRFSLVAWQHPSTLKLITEQSFRLQNASSYQRQTNTNLSHVSAKTP
nr:mannan endo-1,4-beta-mannosidase 6-like [Ipomoea batatas]